MARPRSQKNKDLPPGLYRNGKAYRYLHPNDGTWHGMGTDKVAAIAAAKELNIMLSEPSDLVKGVMGKRKTMGEFSKYFENEIMPPRELSQNTTSQYINRLRTFDAKWKNTALEDITLLAINEMLDEHPPSMSNLLRLLLIDLMANAVAKGLLDVNVAANTLPKIVKKVRKRHTVEGLAAIRAAADPWLQNAIDLALLTTQRRIDIIKLKWSDIRDGWLYVAQTKTTDLDEDDDQEEFEVSGAGYVRIRIDSEIQTVLDRCRKSDVVSPFVIHRIPKKKFKRNLAAKEHWTEIDPDTLTTFFRDARKAANPYPKFTAKQLPGFHEIRALSIHLYKQMGKDPQALAGHTSPEMTELYASGHTTILWNDVEVGLKLPFSD